MKFAYTYPVILLVITVAFLFSACNDDACTDPTNDFTWTQNKSIMIDTESYSEIINDSLIFISEYNIVDGQSNVFEHTFVSQVCEDVFDGFGVTTFAMAIPSDSSNSFSYTDLEIIETSAFYKIFSAPSSLPDHSIEEGEISGVKIDDSTWRISIDVVTKTQEIQEFGDQPVEIRLDTLFSIK
ncbi:hypothetical protein N9L92_02755 [Saprospiraceae bacterium]|nr:hypothetical protein [Saprospiraceae bacterium]